MNNKILALLVSAVMVMVAWVAAVSVPGAEGEGDGKETSPWMLMGNVSMEYQLTPGEPSPTLEMDFNQIAFGKGDGEFDQKITIEWAASEDDYETATFTDDDFNLIYSDDADIPADDYQYTYDEKIDFSEVEKESRGVFNFNMDAKENVTMAPTYFLLRVTVLGDYGENFGEYESFYYYGIHVSIVNAKATAKVVLSSEEDLADVDDVLVDFNDDTAGDGLNTDTGDYDVIEVPKDTELDKVFAYVTIDDARYDSKDFDFYAYGLPAGIAMKIDGVITGKVAVTVPANDENEFQVFAVHKENPGNVLSATYVWKVVAGEDEFEYTVDGVAKPSSEHSYKVLNNVNDSTNISWTPGENETYKVYLTTEDGEKTELTPTNNSVDIGVSEEVEGVPLDGITGIVQVTIDRIVDNEVNATAVIHILVVGPVVHSGLQPVVTAI